MSNIGPTKAKTNENGSDTLQTRYQLWNSSLTCLI